MGEGYEWRAALKYLNDKDLEVLGRRISREIQNLLNAKIEGEKPKENKAMGRLEKEEEKLLKMLREQQQDMSWGLRERYLERLQGLAEEAGRTVKAERQDDFIPRPGNVKDHQRWKEERALDRLETQSELVKHRQNWERECRANRSSDEALKRITAKYQRLGLRVDWREALTLGGQED